MSIQIQIEQIQVQIQQIQSTVVHRVDECWRPFPLGNIANTYGCETKLTKCSTFDRVHQGKPVRGLTKKEAADSTGKDWSRTQVPGSGRKSFTEGSETLSIGLLSECVHWLRLWYLEVWQPYRYTLARCLPSCRKFQPSSPSGVQP